jgi:GNAT superfamily N-acetyltransferase
VLVRPATASDLAEVGRVHALSRQAAYVDLLPAAALARVTAAGQAEAWRTRVAGTSGPHALHVVVVDGRVQGFVFGETGVGTTDDPDRTGLLQALHVLPAQHGTGAGRALHDQLLGDFATWGCSAAELWVLEGNERARSFYRRNGWTADGTSRPHTVGGVDVPALRYRRPVTSATTRG